MAMQQPSNQPSSSSPRARDTAAATASTPTRSQDRPAPLKRQRIDPSQVASSSLSRGSEDVEDDDDDALAREAELARAKAAAKAARQRLKEAKQKLQPQRSSSPTDRSEQFQARDVRKEDPQMASLVRSCPSTPSASSAPGGSSRSKKNRPAPPRDVHPGIMGCRSVHNYEKLNHIEEGSYGVVFRARDKATGEIVALKRLKMEEERSGFPITALREIRTLMEARHPNVVQVKEIVVGDTLTLIFIVMEFVEHDLKTLLTNMRTSFSMSEIKTLMQQLLSAVALLHSNWIIHRDIKTSNLLMNNRGMMKLADFGLARMYGEPLQPDGMTDLVVTLWYRAPELLLGAKEYDTAIDMWSVGCVFAELMLREPLFTGKNETELISKIFRLLGQPTEDSWPGYTRLPGASMLKMAAQPYSTLRQNFKFCSDAGLDLLQRLLTYDPGRRISAEEALRHPWFRESPAPAHPDTFGSFPSVAAGERRREKTPPAPDHGRRQQGARAAPAYELELDI